MPQSQAATGRQSGNTQLQSHTDLLGRKSPSPVLTSRVRAKGLLNLSRHYPKAEKRKPNAPSQSSPLHGNQTSGEHEINPSFTPIPASARCLMKEQSGSSTANISSFPANFVESKEEKESSSCPTVSQHYAPGKHSNTSEAGSLSTASPAHRGRARAPAREIQYASHAEAVGPDLVHVLAVVSSWDRGGLKAPPRRTLVQCPRHHSGSPPAAARLPQRGLTEAGAAQKPRRPRPGEPARRRHPGGTVPADCSPTSVYRALNVPH